MLDHALVAAVAAVVREGSFERAGPALGVTPSAISQRVRLLEDRLGVVLVTRGQPCTATEAGARVCRHAELVGLLEAELRRDLPGLPEAPEPSLRVAVNADSLATWFLPAMAEFARHDATRLHLLVDDQDHTADALRRGHMLAAVTAVATPVQGFRSRRLGALRYVATCSPAFHARWFGAGVTAASLAAAPVLRFNAKDDLQARWARRLLRREPRLSAHLLPSSQAFVEAALAGIGWGMNPLTLVKEHLAAGRLVELVPGRPLDVVLHWQAARLPVPALDALGRAVVRAAEAGLVTDRTSPEGPA